MGRVLCWVVPPDWGQLPFTSSWHLGDHGPLASPEPTMPPHTARCSSSHKGNHWRRPPAGDSEGLPPARPHPPEGAHGPGSRSALGEAGGAKCQPQRDSHDLLSYSRLGDALGASPLLAAGTHSGSGSGSGCRLCGWVLCWCFCHPFAWSSPQSWRPQGRFSRGRRSRRKERGAQAPAAAGGRQEEQLESDPAPRGCAWAWGSWWGDPWWETRGLFRWWRRRGCFVPSPGWVNTWPLCSLMSCI